MPQAKKEVVEGEIIKVLNNEKLCCPALPATNPPKKR